LGSDLKLVPLLSMTDQDVAVYSYGSGQWPFNKITLFLSFLNLYSPNLISQNTSFLLEFQAAIQEVISNHFKILFTYIVIPKNATVLKF